MPELPEVETIVRAVKPYAEGKKIQAIRSDTPRLFRECKSFGAVKKAVEGKRIIALERIGKNIVFRLDGEYDLWLHLMMSGSLLTGREAGKETYIRMEIELDNGKKILFRDIRKFGRVRLVEKIDTSMRLGPDALVVSFSQFAYIIQRKKKAVKTVLLDQSLVCGIGNIYADEILWYAGVMPLRNTDSLSMEEIKKIYKYMNTVLSAAIRVAGTSFRDYRKPDGSEGGYFAARKVYQRTGEACAKDGALIQRTIIAQRGTHFCPAHQL
ncbi:MAG: DNA-formamidopyrimidine glycosylase [Candidatus Sungbacteria bacterium]|nr:DNA-formamidopyrimidine glycosylase [Candidatus Sungbacteria bacterium]